MLPTSLLFAFAAFATVLAKPVSEFQRHAAAVDVRGISGRHQHRSHALSARQDQASKLKKRTSSKKKRCVAKPTSSGSSGAANTAVATPTSTHAHSKSTSSSAPSPTTTSDNDSGNSGSNSTDTGNTSGLIKVQDSQCGPNGATVKVTKGTGPNGAESWMNCGLDGDGWTPPHVTLGDLITVPLDTALQNNNSPYQACSQYLDIFKSIAAETMVNGQPLPDIILPAFALQESSCDPQQQGEGGEVGMFQLSEDKCPGGKASAACFDPETNTKLAAKYIASQIEAAGGNVFQMVGNYNGWTQNMTKSDATKAANSGCCRCQNNIDYLQQFFNGWILNVNAYDQNLGTVQNLNVCGSSDALGRRGLVHQSARRNTPPGKWRF